MVWHYGKYKNKCCVSLVRSSDFLEPHHHFFLLYLPRSNKTGVFCCGVMAACALCLGWGGGSSEGLVLASGVVGVLWFVKVVGLVAVVAVADDRMLDALALQLFLLVNSLQLRHQLSDEGLRRSRGHMELVSGSVGLLHLSVWAQSVIWQWK